jgi:hypothetical protein
MGMLASAEASSTSVLCFPFSSPNFVPTHFTDFLSLRVQEPARDYVTAATQAVLDIHRAEVPGDILVFLTGKSEVHECVDAIKEAATGMAMRHVQGRLKPLPFYAGALRRPPGLRSTLRYPGSEDRLAVDQISTQASCPVSMSTSAM